MDIALTWKSVRASGMNWCIYQSNEQGWKRSEDFALFHISEIHHSFGDMYGNKLLMIFWYRWFINSFETKY